jgi:FMN reductase
MEEQAILVISCSLHPASRSRRLAEEAAACLRSLGAPAELIDLRDFELPLCDGDGSSSTPAALTLREKIAAAPAVLLAAPVYNYDLNAAAKNLVELTGSAWEGKVVGLLCAAGGRSSYMSPIGLANSLMFDFRCWIIPRFVYATRNDFDRGAVASPIKLRVEELVRTTAGLARALDWMKNQAASPAV